MSLDNIETHLHYIKKHREIWLQKKGLRKIYKEFYNQINDALNPIEQKKIIEIGSGIGSIKEVIPDCVCTEIFPISDLDRVENIYNLSIECNGATGFILFDVFHHLEFPGNALDQLHSKLVPGGRVIIFEPYISFFSFFVFYFFHHEPVAMLDQICWKTSDKNLLKNHKYYAAESNSTRIFCTKKYKYLLSDMWNILDIKIDSSVRYLASGGFSGKKLYPDCLYPFFQFLDKFLSKMPRIFGSRVLIVLEKK